MVTQITNNIKISVLTGFQGLFIENHRLRYGFYYQITIENNSNETVQLISRHWEIFDSLNHKETVDGEGVIGKKPIIEPGKSHTYTSGCMLCSGHGAMNGFYEMVNISTGDYIEVVVPTFILSVPYGLN